MTIGTCFDARRYACELVRPEVPAGRHELRSKPASRRRARRSLARRCWRRSARHDRHRCICLNNRGACGPPSTTAGAFLYYARGCHGAGFMAAVMILGMTNNVDGRPRTLEWLNSRQHLLLALQTVGPTLGADRRSSAPWFAGAATP